MYSPILVSSTLVEEGEIIGTLFVWHVGAASIERDDATSPSTATTLSFAINFFTTVEASPCLDWSSSVISLIFLPRTPPALLTSSMARAVPLCDISPKVASLPVSEANSPILITLPDCWVQLARTSANAEATKGKMSLFIRVPASIRQSFTLWLNRSAAKLGKFAARFNRIQRESPADRSSFMQLTSGRGLS